MSFFVIIRLISTETSKLRPRAKLAEVEDVSHEAPLGDTYMKKDRINNSVLFEFPG